MRIARWFVFPVILLCIPVALVFPGGQRSREDVFSENEQLELNATISAAAASGIPESVLQQRVDEGVAKRATAAQIFRALDEKILLMDQSRELLNALEGGGRIRADVGSWQWTAIMLEAGVPPEDIQDLARTSIETGRTNAYRQATRAYVELEDAGVTRELARDLARSLLSSRLARDELPDVARVLARAVSDTVSADEVANIVAAQLQSARSIADLSRAVRAQTIPSDRASDRSDTRSPRRRDEDDDDDRDDEDDDDEDDDEDDDDEDSDDDEDDRDDEEDDRDEDEDD